MWEEAVMHVVLHQQQQRSREQTQRVSGSVLKRSSWRRRRVRREVEHCCRPTEQSQSTNILPSVLHDARLIQTSVITSARLTACN